MYENNKRNLYKESDSQSIKKYAKGLLHKSLRSFLSNDEIKSIMLSRKEKGQLGNLIQEYYFGMKPNSRSEPDFPLAGVELKTTPIRVLKNSSYMPKERLVLNMINYKDIGNETWENSSFLKKNKILLLMFYLYIENQMSLDSVFKIIDLWEYPEEDINIIKNDWNTIVDKIKAKKAHELSEGDTLYLGACRKGAGGIKEKERSQFGGSTTAKSRAFALKTTYMKIVIDSLSGKKDEEIEPFLKVAEGISEYKTLPEIVCEKFSVFYGKSIDKIKNEIGITVGANRKDYCAIVARAILGVKKRKIEEFEKADIQMKIIRLNMNDEPEEDMSFPYFKYLDIVKEKWQESTLKDILSKKFFFVVFQYNEKNELLLRKVMFWNMPYEDLEGEVKRTWDKTVKLVKEGKTNSLPKKSETNITHIRPHGRDSDDKIDIPGGGKDIKRSFWLNKKYIKSILGV